MRTSAPGRGFTLVELLIALAVLGILVVIAVVNYLNAVERGRQRRSMADMRSIATAVEAYAVDFNRYPPPSGFTLPPGLSLPTTDLRHAAAYLEPTYLKIAPLADGWNSWFDYGTNEQGSDYAIRSSGRLGIPQAGPIYGPTTDFRDDIIVVNGSFVQYPDGLQK
jgi:type II secretion system protein G